MINDVMQKGKKKKKKKKMKEKIRDNGGEQV